MGIESSSQSIMIETLDELTIKYKIKDKKSSYINNIKKAKTMINKILKDLNLPSNIGEEVFDIYMNLLSHGSIRGRTIKGYIGASFYYVFRKYYITTTPSDLSHYLEMPTRELTKYHHLLLTTCDLKVNRYTPQTYIKEICRKLGLGRDIEDRAIERLEKIDAIDLSGKNPKTLAAATVYKTCLDLGANVTQTRIAKSVGIKELALRLNFQDLNI